MQLAYVEDEVQRKIHADVRRIGPIPRKWRDWEFCDGTKGLIDDSLKLSKEPDGSQVLEIDGGARLYMPPGGWFFDIKAEHQPLRDASSISEIEAIFKTLPETIDEAQERLVLEHFQLIKEEGQFARMGVFPTAVFESWLFRGFENFLMDILSDPDFASALMRIHSEYWVNYWTPVLEKIGPELDVIFVSDDLGSQHGLIVSEESYRDYIKPLHREMWGRMKKMAPNAKLFLHSCGAIMPLIDHFIELGVDILNPIQISAKGMDPAELKRRYGKDITLWGGGIDTQSVLQRGTPEKIREDVRRHIDQMAPGGGFVFAAVHDIQPETPIENIMAMVEEVQSYGVYN